MEENTTENKPLLANTFMDRLLSLAKGTSGLADMLFPGLGSGLATAIDSIPNQRMDRIVLFVYELDAELKEVKESALREKMKGENFVDLVDDAMRQAAKTYTDERRHYIASLLKHSLTNDQLDHIEVKKLLSILGELNDAEIIILKKFAYDRLYGGNTLVEQVREFYEKHSHVFFAGVVAWNASEEAQQKANFYQAYEDNLRRLGLLAVDSTIQQFDHVRGVGSTPVVERIRISPVGLHLLRYIDAIEDEKEGG